MNFLAVYQQFELIREISEVSKQDLELGREVGVVDKLIHSREKYMASERDMVKRNATNFKNTFTQILQMQTGLSSQTLLPTMLGGASGIGAISPFINKFVQDILSSEQMDKEHGDLKALYEAKLKGTLVQNLDSDGNVIPGQEWKIKDTNQIFSNVDYNKINEIINNANYAQSVKINENQAISSQFNNMVSVWEQEQLARLDAEEEAMIEPLAEKQRSLEMDKAWCEQELERLKAFKESIDRQVADGLKESVPKFGLA